MAWKIQNFAAEDSESESQQHVELEGPKFRESFLGESVGKKLLFRQHLQPERVVDERRQFDIRPRVGILTKEPIVELGIASV